MNKIGGIMFEKSNLKKCKSCGKNLAGSVKECPFCGKRLKSGLFFKLTLGMGLLALIGTLAIPSPENQLKDIQKIATAPLDQINASEIAIICNNHNADMGAQVEIKEKEIKGKIVEWGLEVLVVATLPDHYKILTKPTSNIPGTLLTIYPQNSQQVTFIDSVKPGTIIKIKGKIEGILQGRIKINPALLM
jgi:uncharacterized OB-fold protein